MKVDELVWSSSWHVVALGWILPLPPPPRRVWAQWTHSYSVSLRWKLRSSAFSIWCTRWLNFVGRSAWTSLGQSWTVGLRPVLWTVLSASLIQANSSWIVWNRPKNPSQSSQKAFLIDLSTTFLEKGGSSKKEQLLMGWLKKWLWGIDCSHLLSHLDILSSENEQRPIFWCGAWGSLPESSSGEGEEVGVTNERETTQHTGLEV